MPIFDDRFARQNRCEPPPEFPLASPYTGIVHLLSGPAPYALTQIHPRTSGSVDDAPKLSPAFTFITRRGLTPEHSHTKTTPWSVFQDGSLMTICVQRFDDSLNSAIHITYRILLRSSSMPEPRDPLLKVTYRNRV
jgi:hypothetical protein